MTSSWSACLYLGEITSVAPDGSPCSVLAALYSVRHIAAKVSASKEMSQTVPVRGLKPSVGFPSLTDASEACGLRPGMTWLLPTSLGPLLSLLLSLASFQFLQWMNLLCSKALLTSSWICPEWSSPIPSRDWSSSVSSQLQCRLLVGSLPSPPHISYHHLILFYFLHSSWLFEIICLLVCCWFPQENINCHEGRDLVCLVCLCSAPSPSLSMIKEQSISEEKCGRIYPKI